MLSRNFLRVQPGESLIKASLVEQLSWDGNMIAWSDGVRNCWFLEEICSR
jgi:hypothetical protein